MRHALFRIWCLLHLVGTSPLSAAMAEQGEREIVRRPFGAGRLRLMVDQKGLGTLLLAQKNGEEQPVTCDRLVGAWGLWVGDVEGDGVPEAIVALRKPAKFDPVVENRLHVYAIEDGQCVPVWRGTRLAGRFDDIEASGDRLLVKERVGQRWRVAWYRWQAFGYRLQQTLWQGRGRPPARWRSMFEEGARR
jgi:hypothetical protein